MQEKRSLKAVIAFAIAVALAACAYVVRVLYNLRAIRSSIRESLDTAGVPAEFEDKGFDGIIVLLACVNQRLLVMRERDVNLSEVLTVLKAQLSFLDEILGNYYVYGKSDNKLSLRLSEVIEKRLQRNKAKEAVIRASSVMYPGFLEYLQDRYGFTETDLFYTSLLLCGFSSESQQVLTGNKMASISVARSKAASKTGRKVKLTTFLQEELRNKFPNHR